MTLKQWDEYIKLFENPENNTFLPWLIKCRDKMWQLGIPLQRANIILTKASFTSDNWERAAKLIHRLYIATVPLFGIEYFYSVLKSGNGEFTDE